MHAAIYIGNIDSIPTIVEAIGEGVIQRPLLEFLWDKRQIAIMSPKTSLLDDVERSTAIEWAKKQVGKPYDYMFTIGDDSEEALYCSELCYAAYKHAKSELGFIRKYRGAKKVVPNDFYHAKRYFDLKYETIIK